MTAFAVIDPVAASDAVPNPPRRRQLLAAGLLGFGLTSCVAGARPGASSPAASSLSSSGSRPEADPAGISQIALEHGCFGCATGTLLVMRRDGSAVRTETGNARNGTTDRHFRGSIPVPAFDGLARQAVSQGFFGWQESYQDRQLQDGEWNILRLTRGDQAWQVSQQNGAGPPALTALVQAILAWQASTAFEAVR